MILNDTLQAELDKVTSSNYWVKNTVNSVIVHTQHLPNYEATIRALNDANLHYHTYTTNAMAAKLMHCVHSWYGDSGEPYNREEPEALRTTYK